MNEQADDAASMVPTGIRLEEEDLARVDALRQRFPTRPKRGPMIRALIRYALEKAETDLSTLLKG